LPSEGLLIKQEFSALEQADNLEYNVNLEIESNGATLQTTANKPEVTLCMLGKTIQSLNEMEETI
jgi:hypothetical protein